MIAALFALAAAMAIGGCAAVIQGFPYVRLESGLAMVIAGSVAASSGAVLFGFLLTTPAFAADDASSCAQGITMIRDALAANPSEAALPKLKTALRVAEREQKEGEFDECLDAVADARKALGR